MSNPSGRKGNRWQAGVVEWLRRQGIEAYSLGDGPRGDIGGVKRWTIEAKNEKDYDLAGWIAQLEREMARTNSEYGAVIAHRRGKASPDDAYVLMSGRLWIPVLYDTRG